MPGQQPEIKYYLNLLDDAWGRSGKPVRLLGIGVRFAECEGGSEQLELAL
jgi:DNA polymerase-4